MLGAEFHTSSRWTHEGWMRENPARVSRRAPARRTNPRACAGLLNRQFSINDPARSLRCQRAPRLHFSSVSRRKADHGERRAQNRRWRRERVVTGRSAEDAGRMIAGCTLRRDRPAPIPKVRRITPRRQRRSSSAGASLVRCTGRTWFVFDPRPRFDRITEVHRSRAWRLSLGNADEYERAVGRWEGRCQLRDREAHRGSVERAAPSRADLHPPPSSACSTKSRADRDPAVYFGRFEKDFSGGGGGA